MMNLLSLKNKLSIIVLGLVLTPLLYNVDTQALNYKGPFKSIKPAGQRSAEISDANGNHFIIKVHFSKESALKEMIVAEMGKDIINMSSIQLLPNTIDLDEENLKFCHNQIFTLHTFTDAEPFFDNKPGFQGISNDNDLKTITDNDPSFAQIVAFNLFIYNHYCPAYSLLKDKKTDLFHLVDTDAGLIPEYDPAKYKSPVAITYEYLKTINKKDLSFDSIQALKKFNETLGHLMSLYSLDNLRNLCIEKAMELETSVYDITNLSSYVKNVFNDNEINEVLINHFNKIKMIHAHINYLTK